MTGHSGFTVSLSYSPNGMFIASGSSDSTVRLWDAVTGLQTMVYTGHSDSVWCVAFSIDGLHLASGDVDGKVHIWSTNISNVSTRTFKTQNHVIFLAYISRDWLMVTSKGGSIGIWDIESASCINKHEHLGQLKAFSTASDKKLAISVTETGDVTIWDVNGWTKRAMIKLGKGTPLFRGLWSFSPDSAHLAIPSLNTGTSCSVWDIQARKQIHEFQGHAEPVWAVQLSPDGSLLALVRIEPYVCGI